VYTPLSDSLQCLSAGAVCHLPSITLLLQLLKPTAEAGFKVNILSWEHCAPRLKYLGAKVF